MQEAFQRGAESELSDSDVQILPEEDIDSSLSKKGAAAYKAVIDEQIVGGAIVVIDESTKHNHLDFLYVKYGVHSRGIGQMIWRTIEENHPDTKTWETLTPHFEKEISIFTSIAADLLLLSFSIPAIRIQKYLMA